MPWKMELLLGSSGSFMHQEKKETLPIPAPSIEIKQDTAGRSGFYSCLYINKLVSTMSREAIVHVLTTTVPVESIRIT